MTIAQIAASQLTEQGLPRQRKPMSEAHKRAIGRGNKGKNLGKKYGPRSAEHKEAISKAQRGAHYGDPIVFRLNHSSIVVTRSQYEDMLKAQNGKCAICRRPPKESRLHIDHNHGTLKIRGLLCYSCNIGLGFFKDTPVFLLNALEYLVSRDPEC